MKKGESRTSRRRRWAEQKDEREKEKGRGSEMPSRRKWQEIL